jgi:hypothetical protein
LPALGIEVNRGLPARGRNRRLETEPATGDPLRPHRNSGEPAASVAFWSASKLNADITHL